MSARPEISVIVRARDEQESIARCLDAVARQTANGRGVEVVVVDGGSLDGTRAVARRAGARVVVLPPHAFSYGGSLNLGFANARGDVLVALSAHAIPHDDGWLERIADALGDPRVACATGDRFGPDGESLRGRVLQDAALARRRPEWGYSNSAGAVRAALWRRRPFRSDLIACEDKEWALHWLDEGYVAAIDPELCVDHDHTHDPVRSIYGRARVEWAGMSQFVELDRYRAADLARDWWRDLRWYGSPLRARLSHRRAARLLGMYAGRRAGR